MRSRLIEQHHEMSYKHICSVGSHVRDAAAYVCWAFARAYESEIIAPAVHHLAPALLAVACYDREVALLRLIFKIVVTPQQCHHGATPAVRQSKISIDMHLQCQKFAFETLRHL